MSDNRLYQSHLKTQRALSMLLQPLMMLGDIFKPQTAIDCSNCQKLANEAILLDEMGARCAVARI
ncbi:hypothetical protein [Cupriavidus yeoncheonensis]|uniref:hypothetical protein n=1 Tax=Cupriavidus yeoncheonensis TaxID=1462994 RepID=UPI001BA48AF1|nr:hypothetical protein [Cupriavidus yeoncheonensis]